MAKKKHTFESALARMEEIADLLENGDAPLADSVKLYKEGADMAQICAESLEQAESEVLLLQSNASGSFTLTPFAEESE